MALLSIAAKQLDDLLRMGYPEEVAQRIVSGDLPMDTASRMERAKDMGFDPTNVQYHGTEADFTEFNPSMRGKMGPGVYASPDPNVADKYIYGTGSNIIPIVTRGNYLRRSQAVNDNPSLSGRDANSELSKIVADQGYSGMAGGHLGTPVITETVTFDPANIRSYLSAAFDPEYKGPNILGFNGGQNGQSLLQAATNSGVGAASMASSGPEEKLYQGLTDKMIDYLTEQMGGSKEDRERAEYISMGMDFLPYVGAAKGVSETFDAYKNDDTLGMALGAAGAIAGMFPFGRSAYKGILGAIEDAPTVTRDADLLQRVGDVDSVNTMKLEVEPGPELVPSRQLSAADLEGRGYVSGMADTSQGDLSRVVAINDQPVDVVRFGGQKYMRQPNNAEQGILWASDSGAVTGLLNAAKAASELPGASRPPLYIPYGMGGASTDFATMTSDIMVPVARQNMSKSAKRALDKRIRAGAGNKKNEFKPQPDWPGIDSPKADEWLLNAGGDRKAITKAIDEFRDQAGINLSQARAAIVDPNQLSPRVGNLLEAGILDLSRAPQPGVHPSYNTDLMGTYLGQFGAGANLLDDLNPLIRSSGQPFVPEMISRGHNLSGNTIPSPVGKAMQAGLIGMFDQATLDALIKKGVIKP